MANNNNIDLGLIVALIKKLGGSAEFEISVILVVPHCMS